MKRKIALSVYIAVKLILTPFVPTICVFGVFAVPFSIALGLNGGIINILAKLLLIAPVLWITLLIIQCLMKQLNKKVIYGFVILSLIEVVCLTASVISNITAYDAAVSGLIMIILKIVSVLVNMTFVISLLIMNKK